MKKLLSVFAFVLFAMAVNAQSKPATENSGTQTTSNTDATHMQDCMMMSDGKMMMMKSGKMMPMTNDMKMENGSVMTMKGEVMMEDGKTMMMKNGDCMDMKGNMMKPMKDMKGHSMNTDTPEQKKQAETKQE